MRTGLPRLALPLAALLALGMFVASADAATVGSLIQPGDNFASDNNAEWLAVDQDGDGQLDKGDVIRGAIDINTLNDTNANVGGSTGNHQWAGVFSLRVRDIINFNAVTQTGDIIFEPDPGFAAWVATLDTDRNTAGQQAPAGPSIATNTIARLWTNATATTNFTSNFTGSPTTNVGTAAVGTFFWDLGFKNPTAASHAVDTNGDATLDTVVSDNGEGWVAQNGGINIAFLKTATSSTTYAPGNFGLTVLQKGGDGDFTLLLQEWTLATAFKIGADVGDKVEIIGSSTVRGAKNFEANAGFQAGSDTNFTFLAIPLPTAAWPGLGLLFGLGLFRLRRRKSEE